MKKNAVLKIIFYSWIEFDLIVSWILSEQNQVKTNLLASPGENPLLTMNPCAG
jgi:hypothetical protein